MNNPKVGSYETHNERCRTPPNQTYFLFYRRYNRCRVDFRLPLATRLIHPDFTPSYPRFSVYFYTENHSLGKIIICRNLIFWSADQ